MFHSQTLELTDDLIDPGISGISQMKASQHQIDIFLIQTFGLSDHRIHPWMSAAGNDDQSFGCIDHQALFRRRAGHFSGADHIIQDLHSWPDLDQLGLTPKTALKLIRK